MAEFQISIDQSSLLAAGPGLRAEVFRNLAAAVSRVVDTGVERWRSAVLVAPLWEGERRAYADSIRGDMVNDFEGEIVSNYRYVEDIEGGRPAYDLKQMLGTSLKVRVSAKGRRYLIIPMRHNTPGNTALAPAMPKGVYAEAKDLSASKIVGHGRRLSGTGAFDVATRMPLTVRSRKYLWGGRLPAGLAPKLRKEHKTDPFAGMVRFKESTGGSTYLTFRVMAEGSPGWILPPKAGLGIAAAVAMSLQRTVDSEFPSALDADAA